MVEVQLGATEDLVQDADTHQEGLTVAARVASRQESVICHMTCALWCQCEPLVFALLSLANSALVYHVGALMIQ